MLRVCSMADLQPNFLIFGTALGEIYLVKQSCLSTDTGDHLIESFSDKEMCLGKGY